MTLTTEQLMDYSWLSQASYLGFEGVPADMTGTDLAGVLTRSDQINNQNIFSSTQAANFTDLIDGFSFISYEPNDSTGFSATVFKSNEVDANGNSTNEYTIAVRGTEGLISKDLWNADVLEVGLKGAAYGQTLSAYLYYKQLATAEGTTVSYSQAELDMLGELYIAASLPAVPSHLEVTAFLDSLQDPSLEMNVGLGALTEGATVNFTGHSLGGHVATLLAGLVNEFGNQGSGGSLLWGSGNGGQVSTTVGDVVTFNAPGMGGIFDALDVPIDVQAISSNITNIIGEAGMDVIPSVGVTSGQTDILFIEDAGLIGSILAGNHAVVPLSDSLAVYDAFAKIDPALSVNDITGILTASDNTASESLESAVSANDDFQVSIRLAA